MKRFITCVLLGICFYTMVFSQVQTAEPSITKPNCRMRNTGIVLLSAGVATLASGLIIGLNTGGFSYNYQNSNGVVSESGRPIQGLAGVMVILGTISTAGGTLFTIFGQKKINNQKRNLNLTFTPSGLNLCYHL